MSEDRLRPGEPANPEASGRTDPESTFHLLDRARAGGQNALEPAESLPVFERMGLGPFGRRPPRLAFAYVMLGRRADAEALAAEHADGFPAGQVLIYTALGDKDRAFEALERMAAAEPPRISVRLAHPELAVLRGDPRFKALRERFRLPPQ